MCIHVACWGLHWEGVLNVGVGGCVECWGLHWEGVLNVGVYIGRVC